MASGFSQLLSSPSLYPNPPTAALKQQYVGKQINDVQPPAAIVDAAVVRRNCKMMLEATEKLGLGFRAHVKTHKTTEITRLQVGEDSSCVKLVCSTVAEIESLLPWLLLCKSNGKIVDVRDPKSRPLASADLQKVLYGLPISLTQIPRLGHIVSLLGTGTIGLFVDHPAHIKALDKVTESTWPGRIPVWVNIDVGYHREGVAADSAQLADIAYALAVSERVHLAGLYTHFGTSYNSSSPEEALDYMATELNSLKDGAVSFLKCLQQNKSRDGTATKVVLSLGATPTATSTQNLLENAEGVGRYRDLLQELNEAFAVELHAGVYPLLDMQQLATRARPQRGAHSLSYCDLGFRILAEVASLYPDRGEKPEALIAAGSIVLGREPCKSYEGWAVVTPWPLKDGHHYDPEGSRTGWIVGRISQEHGVLVWEGSREHFRPLEFGKKVLLWPNHACIAGVNFGWYLVVDSDTAEPELIRDVWMRSRGW